MFWSIYPYTYEGSPYASFTCLLLRWLYHREHLGAAPKGSTPRSRFGSTTVGDIDIKLHVLFKYFRLVLCFSKLVFARRWHPPVIGSFLNPRRALVREAQHWQKSKTFCYASSKPTEKSVGLHCRYLLVYVMTVSTKVFATFMHRLVKAFTFTLGNIWFGGAYLYRTVWTSLGVQKRCL